MFLPAHPHIQAAHSEAKDLLNQAVEAQRYDMTRSIQELVRIKSIKGEKSPGMPFGPGPAEALDKALDIAKGIEFKIANLDGYVGYAEFGQGDEYVGVLAHLDVVPEGENWTYPPYGAEIHDGKIYGRGAIDNKGPAMAALYAAKALKDSGLPISKRVRVIFGTTEETGREDVMYYLQHEKPPAFGFTPDAYFPLIYAEKGNANFYLARDLANKSSGTRIIRIRGGNAGNSVPDRAYAEVSTPDPASLARSCQEFANQTGYDLKAEEIEARDGMVSINSRGLAAHGSKPGRGKNAVMQLLAFLGTFDQDGSDMACAIEFLNSKVDMETDGRSFGVAMSDNVSGSLTFNVGTVNATEGGIELALNLRYPVTCKFEDMMAKFNKTIECTGFKVERMRNQNPLYFPLDSPLVEVLLKVYRDQTGQDGKPLAIGGGTYAKQMPNTVAFGPNFPGQPLIEHEADEYASIDDLVRASKIYAQAMYELAR